MVPTLALVEQLRTPWILRVPQGVVYLSPTIAQVIGYSSRTAAVEVQERRSRHCLSGGAGTETQSPVPSSFLGPQTLLRALRNPLNQPNNNCSWPTSILPLRKLGPREEQ